MTKSLGVYPLCKALLLPRQTKQCKLNKINIVLKGIEHVSLKNIFVSHRGQDEDNCGNWTLPCRSVRHAVNISNANDVIHIDYAEGRPYKECEHLIGGNHTIMLDKSLSFYGFNGTAILDCEQPYSFFGINSPLFSTPKVVFSNLSLATHGIILLNAASIYVSSFELEFKFCDINRSSYFVMAFALSCSIQVVNCNIRSDLNPIMLTCTFLKARLTGSTFFSCSVELVSERFLFRQRHYDRKPSLDVHIYNCTFTLSKRQPSCNSFVEIFSWSAIGNITIASSVFTYFCNSQALGIYSSLESIKINIVLDRLRFEHLYCDYGVVSIELWQTIDSNLINVGIFNSVFVNTTRALVISFPGYSSAPLATVILHNNTFNITHNIFGNEGLAYLFGGSYHFSSCRFFQHVPLYNPEFPLIHVERPASIEFKNCWYESYLITETSRNGNLSNSNMFYVISYRSLEGERLVMKGYFTILCPIGYTIHLKTDCYKEVNCNLFTAFCVQCPRKAYSLDRGEAHNTRSNYITCHECPVGGNCVEGQVTSKPNFWGYKSNRQVKFLQCPSKYCCDTNHCSHYNSCHGNRMGTLCGECPSAMSESLFDTKCKANKDCTSVTFWPAISAYLTLYLLFFLYQNDIINFVLRRITPGYFLSSRNGRNSKPGGFPKIIFYYYQVVHLLSNSVGSDVKVQFFGDIENLLSRAFNFLIIPRSWSCSKSDHCSFCRI